MSTDTLAHTVVYFFSSDRDTTQASHRARGREGGLEGEETVEVDEVAVVAVEICVNVRVHLAVKGF